MNKQTFSDSSEALFKIFPTIRRIVYEAFDRHNTKITRTQQMILVTMANSETLSMSELARRISTSNEQATRAVAQLVNSGFIERVQNETNRRIVNIKLTPQANVFLGEVRDLAAELFSEKMDGFSAADSRRLFDSLTVISDTICAENVSE